MEAYNEYLCLVYFDHSLLLMRCGGKQPNKPKCLFRFQATCSSHKGFELIVKKAWAKQAFNIQGKLDNVKENALVFNKKVFGNIFWRKQDIEARLKGVQRSLEKQDFESLKRLEKELHEEYNEVLLRKNSCGQKSHEKWV